MLCDKHFKSTSFKEKTLNKKQLANCLLTETELKKNIEQDILNDMEVVVVKTESDDVNVIQEHCVQTRNMQIGESLGNMAEIKNKQKKTPLKRSIEEWAEVDTQKKTNEMWIIEHPEKSQDDFNDACNEWFAKTSKYEQNDDCQLYGILLTKKLRTYSEYERNLLMFKIDGLLIENPPGFDTSSNFFSIIPTKNSNKVSHDRQKSRTKDSPLSAMNLNISSNKASKTKKKKLKIESQALQMSSPIEESYTKVTSSSLPSLSPVNQPAKVTNTEFYHKFLAKGIGSIQKVTSSIPNQTIKVTSDIPNQHVKATSSIPNQSLKVSSSIPNKPVKVTSISNQPIAPQASSSVPSHLPLQITIPETRFVPLTQSKFVASSKHPKGKIVIMKSRPGKYVMSSQPPILITVPSSSIPSVNFPTSSQNSLEQLSSSAITPASQVDQYQLRFDSEENGTADNVNVVSHEIILPASTDSSI